MIVIIWYNFFEVIRVSNIKKLLNNIAIIQIVLCVLVFISMYIPIIHVRAGTIDQNYNTFLALTGVTDTKANKEFFVFSFWALLPYLLILVVILLNVVIDNKKNVIVHIIKALLLLISAIMILNFKSLMKPSEDYTVDLLRFVTYRPGRIITPIIIFINFLTTIFEILMDFNILKKD